MGFVQNFVIPPLVHREEEQLNSPCRRRRFVGWPFTGKTETRNLCILGFAFLSLLLQHREPVKGPEGDSKSVSLACRN